MDYVAWRIHCAAVHSPPGRFATSQRPAIAAASESMPTQPAVSDTPEPTRPVQRYNFGWHAVLGKAIPVTPDRIPGPMMQAAPQTPSTLVQASSPLEEVDPSTLSHIVRFVGARDLEAQWVCTECNPYWHNWYCYQCHKTNHILRWTPAAHFGQCGQSCGCCRFAEGESFGSCEACENIQPLRLTSRFM